jgi:hypothetical protein
MRLPDNSILVYVRNQKAGSEMMWATLSAIMQTPVYRTYKLPFPYINGSEPMRTITDDLFMWTVVRDPLHRAISGYLEILARKASHTKEEASILSQCRHDPTGQFTRFMRLLSSSKDLQFEGMHARPQAILLDVMKQERPKKNGKSRRYDAIAKIENLQIEMPKVLKLAGMDENLIQMNWTVQHHHSHQAREAHGECGDVDWRDPILMKMFCNFYEVDYICLDYNMPRICQDLIPGYGTKTRLRHRRLRDAKEDGKNKESGKAIP